MNNFDHRDLDWHLLHIFLIVLQESNVTRAAERLDLTQSAVSHALNKLRGIFGDPLFVRSGRGITPTERARNLREPVTNVMIAMKRLSDDRAFDPAAQPLRFTVAASDLTRDLLFPELVKQAARSDIDLHLTFMPSGVPTANLLNDGHCDLVLTPRPPDGPEILQLKLFEGEMACFFDADVRDPPKSWEEFKNCRHVEVRFTTGGNSFNVTSTLDSAALREPMVSVSNFSAIPCFVKGSDMIAAELNYMSLGPLKELDRAPLPFPTDPVGVFLVWHRKDSTDPAHHWFRDRIVDAAKALPPLS